ncbi:uncharacterized protein LOC120272170 [Dioscorea cayenensis subsp. rotundata]|uniref:Uncharacterized protein LOC120272170 n=1 Tax=Dioscorea cayennensis subsp. rotundata TaxID=55577 RepID=A0AB40C5G2_DIOCR|nr:uncharacterized protein LOC120272170 [Dioscorea cayenensis subsp. rotundata]
MADADNSTKVPLLKICHCITDLFFDMSSSAPSRKPPSQPPDPSSTIPGVSWARVVGSSSRTSAFDLPLHLQKPHFDKLKISTHSCISIDRDQWLTARDKMHSALYAKFLGKSLPLDQAKHALADAWKGLGEFSITDLPNGFYFIRCESIEMQSKLLWDGPWTIDGRILQLSEWRESFQPAFEKLSTSAVWLQLHVPIELWHGDLLESIASHFGKVLKIDEHTLNLSRSKYARICIELDLDLPLQKGTWVKYGDNSIFILALYEKLPVFCYSCGRIGHGESNYPLVSSRRANSAPQPPTGSTERVMEVDEPPRSPGVANEQRMDSLVPNEPNLNPIPGTDDDSSAF